MQKISNTLFDRITGTAKTVQTVCEFYKSSATPGADGFDPASDDFIFGAATVSGIEFRGREYKRLATDIGTVKSTIREELSTASVTLSNSSREMVDFELDTGFEGLIFVVRVLDYTASVELEDSIVKFTGRCERPKQFDKSSEKVTVSAKQILDQTENIIPRRKFTPDDLAGRAPSDPLFEGFRYTPRGGTVVYKERKKVFFVFHRTVTRTLQFSSHSDLDADKSVPVCLGRAQMLLNIFASADYGEEIQFLAIACDGEIEGFRNIRSVTPGFPVYVFSEKQGKLGGVDNQINDDVPFIGSGIYSRTAYIRAKATGTERAVDDGAPDVAAVILGMKIPVPDLDTGEFTALAWSDNPAFHARWLIGSPDYFGMASAWFDDEAIRQTADYCDHILADQSNSETVQYHQSQQGIAGVQYNNYQSTAATSADFWRSRSNHFFLSDAAMREAIYQFYNELPVNSDDAGGGTPVLPPTNYLRRYTSNVLLSEQMKAIEFLYKILLPSFNGYVTQTAKGKLAIKVKKPSDFSFALSANTVGATEIHVKNINPFAAKPGRLLIGAHLPTSEVRKITGHRYDTATVVNITATGGVSSSAATLSGGNDTTAPFAVLTITAAAPTKTINIDGYVLNFNPSATDDTVTVAGGLSGMINSHNELNKFVKAAWTPGESTVNVSSRIGFLTLDAPLEEIHNPAIANPATAPAATTTTGTLAAGDYLLCYSYTTIEGETLTGPNQILTLADNQAIAVPAITLPARVLSAKWYVSIEPNGVRTRFIKETNGAFVINELPRTSAAVEQVTNTTAAEVMRIAMVFTDKGAPHTSLSRSNVVKGSPKVLIASSESVNRIDIKYRDASQDFQASELRVKDEAHIKKVNKVNNREVNGAAIDNYSQARRLANQYLAEARDGDVLATGEATGEALLLEEFDIICYSDESGRLRNATYSVSDISFKPGGVPTVNFTGRKYRRSFYDDQVQEKLVPLPLVVNSEPNTEQIAPAIYQASTATADAFDLGARGYTSAAKYRRIEFSPAADFSNVSATVVNASDYPNNQLPEVTQVSKILLAGESDTAAIVRYYRVSHSSNGATYGAASSPPLPVTFADSNGGGGSDGGGGVTGTAPSDLTAYGTGAGGYECVWVNHGATGANNIYRRRGLAGAWILDGTVEANESYYSGAIDFRGTYYFRIENESAAGEYSYSDAVSIFVEFEPGI